MGPLSTLSFRSAWFWREESASDVTIKKQIPPPPRSEFGMTVSRGSQRSQQSWRPCADERCYGLSFGGVTAEGGCATAAVPQRLCHKRWQCVGSCLLKVECYVQEPAWKPCGKTFASESACFA